MLRTHRDDKEVDKNEKKNETDCRINTLLKALHKIHICVQLFRCTPTVNKHILIVLPRPMSAAPLYIQFVCYTKVSTFLAYF